jgi:DNA-directed RNA polymerase specialized sigma24 family protein
LFVERRDLDPAEADRVLAALACRAPEDTLAARVLLQLLLPGCKALVRRYGGSDPEERAGTVVAAAWDRIRTYPIDRRPLRIAANVLLDVRQRVVRGFSRRPRPVSLDAIPHDAVLASSDPGDESDGAASLLAWGVRHGHLDHETARLIALTRLAGVQVSELARETGTDAQTLRRRRLRAEQRLRRALEAA